MFATAKALVLAAKLFAASDASVATAICVEAHGDRASRVEACVCSLETYRCERQGWCSAPDANFEGGYRGLPSPERTVQACQ